MGVVRGTDTTVGLFFFAALMVCLDTTCVQSMSSSSSEVLLLSPYCRVDNVGFSFRIDVVVLFKLLIVVDVLVVVVLILLLLLFVKLIRSNFVKAFVALLGRGSFPDANALTERGKCVAVCCFVLHVVLGGTVFGPFLQSAFVFKKDSVLVWTRTFVPGLRGRCGEGRYAAAWRFDFMTMKEYVQLGT